MARFPEDVLARLKQEVSIVRLVEASGVVLKPHGQDKIGHCPFHDDRTPSLVVSPSNNLWHCLGACQCGGSVIDWVMKSQGISFRHAVELLKNDVPALATSSPASVPVKKSTTKKLDVLLSEDSEAQALLHQVVDFYHETLLQSPEALAYLQSRGLDDMELIKRFKLGYANRTLGYRLPEKNRKAGAEVRGKLQEIGLLRKSGHEHFSGSLVVPLFNPDGEVVEVYGRKVLGNRLRKGTPQHLYLPGPHAGVWNREGLEGQTEIILCEALIDAMTFWVNGYRNVTASYGTSGFTEEHLAVFKTCGAQRILIAYDRDDAGNAAADKLAKKLTAEGFACYRLLFPKNMDANQYALEVAPAGKSLGLVIRSAEWLGEGQAPERQLDIAMQTGGSEIQEVAPVPESSTPSSESSTSLAADPAPLPPARAVPEAPSELPDPEVSDKEIRFSFGNRQYRVRGLERNKNYEVLKINLLAACGDQLHVDTFDLYAAKVRQGFIRVAALELGLDEKVIKADVGKVLLKLEAVQEELINGSLPSSAQASVVPALSASEQEAALALLRDPDLLSRIQADFAACGVVGEGTNTLVGYLAASSRKLERPLAVIIQSTSAAGKSALMEAILGLMPEEERVQYSAMTGQSLFYMGETNLKHKILAISEEEGVSQAAYALKLLQSEGQITIASTGKNDTTGDLVTKDYTVEGPVMLLLTTTAIDIDEELLNRCLVLTVNESREQTQAIHAAQRARRTLKGLEGKLARDECQRLHRNAQRLLRPLAVINPYADQLTFLSDKTRTRRDHEKYLTLIDSIALLHQHQREVKTLTRHGQALEYIEVTLDDISAANALAHEVLGRTLDELPPQTRKLLSLIQSMVSTACEQQQISQGDYRFSRRELREAIQWSDTALKVHLSRLVELEYLLVHRSGQGQRHAYELLYDKPGADHEPHLMGLIDCETLKQQGKKEMQPYDANRSGQEDKQSGAGQPPVGGWSDNENTSKPLNGAPWRESGVETGNATSAAKSKTPRTIAMA